MDESDLILFLEAVKESKSSNEQDLEEVRSELEVFKSQLQKLSKRYNESIIKQRKQEEVIERMSREKTRLKKQLIESNFQCKQLQLQLLTATDESKQLKSDLRAKGDMILSLETERRQLQVQLARSDRQECGCSSRMSNHRRSFSADRLLDQRKQLGRQLAKTGQSSAYFVSKKRHKQKFASDLDAQADFEKVVLLQKILLSKTKLLTEKEVKIEQLEKSNQEMSQQVSRLKATRHLAIELSDTRHKLALKSNQLEVVKKQLDEATSDLERHKVEIGRLRERLHEFYSDKLSLFAVNLRSE